LTSIGGHLGIKNNDELQSLDGLDNIEAGSIDDLTIKDNSSLSTCEVQSICEYLTAPGGSVSISNNDYGCRTRGEVEHACMVGINQVQIAACGLQIKVYPNPAGRIMNIEYVLANSGAKASRLKNVEEISICVFDLYGKKVAVLVDEQQAAGEHLVQFDITGLAAGLYLVLLKAGNNITTEKILVY